MYNNINGDFKSRLISERKIPAENIDKLEKKGLLFFENDYALFSMKDLDGNIVGHQKRFAKSKRLGDKELKSQTCQGEHVGYYYLDLDFSKPIIICEGEIDFLSLCHIENIIGLQGVQNLKKLVDRLLEKEVPEIYILVDHDTAGDDSIGKLLELDDNKLKKIHDSRLVLLDKNDVNDLIKSGGEIKDENIFLFAKNLYEYKKLMGSFFIKGIRGADRINYKAFAEFLVQEYDIATANKNVFRYHRKGEKYGIRTLEDDNDFLADVTKWTDKYLGYRKTIIDGGEVNEIIKKIFAYSNCKKLKSTLIKQNSTDLSLDDCIYDVGTGKIREYTKEDYKFNKFPFTLQDLNSDEPKKFLKFLDEIFEGYNDKEELIGILQEYLGLLTIPYVKFEKILILFGSGCNGKGIITRIIGDTLGKDNCSYLSLQEINSQTNRTCLINKLVNIDSDVNDKVRLDEGPIKKVISGEIMDMRYYYNNTSDFIPTTRLLMATNIMPYIKHNDSSITRRLIIIHLKNSFKNKENRNLFNELIEEKTKIFAWMIRGLKRLLERGDFIIPDSVQQEIDKLIFNENTVSKFINEDQDIILDKKQYAKMGVLYEKYKTFCNNKGYDAVGKHGFDERVENMGFKKTKKDGERCFKGIGINNSGHLDISNEQKIF